MVINRSEDCTTEAEFTREVIKKEFNRTFADGGTCDEATNILSFEIANEQAGETVIDTAKHSITLEVFSDADITALIASIILSEGATSDPVTEVPQSFTNSTVSYTVTGQDGITTQGRTMNVVFTDQRPFITSWSTVAGNSITIELNDDFDYNFN
jgi:hypothetical protein